MHERGRLGLNAGFPGVHPRRVSGIASMSTEALKIHHWIKRFSVGGDFATCMRPEVVRLGISTVAGRMSEIVRAHLQSGCFAPVHVGSVVRINIAYAFRGF